MPTLKEIKDMLVKAEQEAEQAIESVFESKEPEVGGAPGPDAPPAHSSSQSASTAKPFSRASRRMSWRSSPWTSAPWRTRGTPSRARCQEEAGASPWGPWGGSRRAPC